MVDIICLCLQDWLDWDLPGIFLRTIWEDTLLTLPGIFVRTICEDTLFVQSLISLVDCESWAMSNMWENPLVVCLGYYNIVQTGWLQQQKFTFLQFWNIEVKDQGASRGGFWWGLSAWLIDGHLLVLSSPVLPFTLYIDNPGGSSSSYEDTSVIWLRPQLMTPFSLNYLLQCPISKHTSIGWLGCQHVNFGGL